MLAQAVGRGADKRFEALLLASASIVWWTDADGGFAEEQPYWQQYTGQSWDEYRGSRWVSCLHPEDRESIFADWTQAVASRSPYFTQGRIWSAKHKAYRAFQARGIPVKNGAGRVEEWLGALIDIQDSIDIGTLLDRTRTDLANSLKAFRVSEATAQKQLEELRAAEEALRESEARLAREAAALKMLNDASSKLWQISDLGEGLNEMLRAAIEFLGAGKGNIRLLDPAGSLLTIKAQQGFEKPFLEVFKEVSAGDGTACGRALRSGRRIVIEDVEACEAYAPYRAAARQAGYRALQSTPLIGSAGSPLGMLSTHFKKPHRPTGHELQLLDLYVRQAADFIERHRKDQKLRQSEELYKGVFQHAGIGIFITNLDGRLLSCNPAYSRMHGYSEDELRRLTLGEVVHPDDRGRQALQIAKLACGEIESCEFVNRCVAKNGEHHWVHKHVSLLRDEAGKPFRILALVTDITGHKRHEEQIELLLREVDHRSKNMLTLVQAIAHQTAAATPEDFVRRFDERIRALAASQDLLVKAEWKGVGLNELIRSQLAHFGGLIDGRIILKGPPLTLSPSAAQGLGMAIHELATNAGKYGALSNDAGRVDIEWGLKAENGEESFTIAWRERSGPPVKAPVRSGFGSIVTCRMAEKSLNAKVELEYQPAGLAWTLECPAEALMESASQAPKKIRPEHQAHGKPRILVVEDETFVGLFIEQLLQDQGFDVLGPANSVAQALALLNRCDAALLDISLGDETSEPIAKELARQGKPFVVMSGYGGDKLPDAFDGAAAVMKPIQSELLLEQLKRCLEKDSHARPGAR